MAFRHVLPYRRLHAGSCVAHADWAQCAAHAASELLLHVQLSASSHHRQRTSLHAYSCLELRSVLPESLCCLEISSVHALEHSSAAAS